MALREVMQMKESDMEFLVDKFNGALGGTGTSSGDKCDKTRVHCNFASTDIIQIQRADKKESPSGFKLAIGDSQFAIGLEKE